MKRSQIIARTGVRRQVGGIDEFQTSSIFVRFRAGCSAVTSIEFAMLAPLLMMIIVETMQIGLYSYTSAAVRDATNSAGRQIMTGAVARAGLTADAFRTQILCSNLPAALSCDNFVTNVVTVQEGASPNGFYTLLNASQTGLAQPVLDSNKTSFCPGQGGSYVVVEVYYAMPVISPIWTVSAVAWRGSNVHFVNAVTAFKNEPFGEANAAAC